MGSKWGRVENTRGWRDGVVIVVEVLDFVPLNPTLNSLRFVI